MIDRQGQIELRTTQTEFDLTSRMRAFAQERVERLAVDELRGFVVKSGSPSCGLERVKVRQAKGPSSRSGRGLFTQILVERFPNLPVEEEGRLTDARLRENWVERVFAYAALSRLWSTRWKYVDLVQFHTRYKFLLLAHSQREYRELGRLVGEGRSLERGVLQVRYEQLFMRALQRIATPAKNANVLQHMLGFLKRELDRETRDEILTLIAEYRHGLVPLLVPLALLRHYVRVLGVAYLGEQAYLNPHPRELALRNHV